MQSLRLTQPAYLKARTFWGWRSDVQFLPANPGCDWGWSSPNRHINITPQIMEYHRGRIILRHEGCTLHGLEEIGLLRMAGLQNVTIRTRSRHVYLPRGCARRVWEQVLFHRAVADVELRPCTIRHRPNLPRPSYRLANNETGWTEYTPNSGAELKGELEVTAFDGDRARYESSEGVERLYELTRARTPAECCLREMLATLNFATPSGFYLTGAWHAVGGTPETHLGLLKYFAAQKNIIDIGSRQRVA